MADRAYPAGPSMWRAMRALRALGGGSDLAEIPTFLTELARTYGGIAHWWMLGRHFFFVDDPALIEELLVRRALDFKKGRGIERLRRLVGNGLLTSAEPLHLRRRRLIQPAFHRGRIDGYGRQMVAATGAELNTWRTDLPLDIDVAMTRLTLTIAAKTLFGANLAHRNDAIRDALTTALRAFPGSLSPWSELLDALPILPVTRRFDRARARLDAVIFEMIATRRDDLAAGHDDLLAMLLEARDDDGTLDDVAVRDEAMTLFLAGHETTANVLAWTWYLLGRYPTQARRLRRELDDVLGERLPETADVLNLPFTRAIFAETMRLYPPAWILGRRALRATQLGVYRIPRGSVVIASQLVTGRNPRYWSAADEFAPERWSAEPPAAKFAYFPFGGGNRRCIGESFAWMEGVLLIATIAQRFEITPVDATPVDVEPLVTLRPRSPIRVRIAARHPLSRTPAQE